MATPSRVRKTGMRGLQHTAGRGLLLAAGLLGLGATGCAKPPGPLSEDEVRQRLAALDAAAASAAEPAPTSGVRVRLFFAAGADLDLYVTDPLQETVYFANTPSRSGGELVADRRCDAPAPRIETTRFDLAPPGRYRVGVDYSKACGKPRDSPEAQVFRVVVEHDGRSQSLSGQIQPGHFLAVVTEFEVGS